MDTPETPSPAASAAAPTPWPPGASVPPNWPPPSRRRISPAVVVGVIVVAVAGFIGSVIVGAALGERRHSGTVVATPAAAAPGHPGDLAKYLMPAPQGATAWDGQPGEETFELKGAGDYLVVHDPSEQPLDRAGFTRGAVRRWVDGDGQRIQVVLFEFDRPLNCWQFEEDYANALSISRVWVGKGSGAGFLFATRRPDAAGFNQQIDVNYVGDVMVTVQVGSTASIEPRTAEQLVTAQDALL